MDPISEVGATGAQSTGGMGSTATGATDAFGLSFDALLKIVLTQLTYQDPLKPMDNFQFVSQLAQFSQIQQGSQMVDSLNALIAAQTTSQAAGLLGRVVDITMEQGTLCGKVVGASFTGGGGATITIETADGQTISGLPLGNVSQIREAN